MSFFKRWNCGVFVVFFFKVETICYAAVSSIMFKSHSYGSDPMNLLSVSFSQSLYKTFNWKGRGRPSIRCFIPQMPAIIGVGLERIQDPRTTSHMGSRDPRIWAITCCLRRCTSSGCWSLHQAGIRASQGMLVPWNTASLWWKLTGHRWSKPKNQSPLEATLMDFKWSESLLVCFLTCIYPLESKSSSTFFFLSRKFQTFK